MNRFIYFTIIFLANFSAESVSFRSLEGGDRGLRVISSICQNEIDEGLKKVSFPNGSDIS
jgi:hypothetical protein